MNSDTCRAREIQGEKGMGDEPAKVTPRSEKRTDQETPEECDPRAGGTAETRKMIKREREKFSHQLQKH